MSIVFKKKKMFYCGFGSNTLLLAAGVFDFLCLASIVLLCMSDTGIMNHNMPYSFFDAISKCSESRLKESTIQSIFAYGSSSYWFYLVMPIVAAIPVASFISDEWKNKFHLYEKMRGGTFWYLRSRSAYALVNCAVVLFLGLGVYMLVVCRYFNLEAVYTEGVMFTGGEQEGIAELLHYCAAKYVYLVVYSFAISLFILLLVLLYNDLFFDLSVAFILNYLFRDWFRGDRIVYPLLLIAFLLIAYMLLWKKGKKV